MVSHHPVIFDAMKSVTDTDVVFEYITNGVAVRMAVMKMLISGGF